jgi:hypothetical protein
MSLIYEQLSPTTFSIGFLRCSFDQVRNAFIQWKNEHFRSLTSKEVQLPLLSALEELQPLTPIPRRWLLVPTASEWVGYFDNGIHGPDPAPSVSYLSLKLACQGLVATSVPQVLWKGQGTNSALYGAVQFELFAPTKTAFLNCERSISIAYDGAKWMFSARGAIQSFEEVSKYGSPRVLDRFTPDMLKRYCGALGIKIDSAEFYKSPSTLISSADPLPQGAAAISIEEAQKKMGLVI